MTSRKRDTVILVAGCVVGLTFLAILGVSLIQQAVYNHDQARSLSSAGELGLIVLEPVEIAGLIFAGCGKAGIGSRAKRIGVVIVAECAISFSLLVAIAGFPFF